MTISDERLEEITLSPIMGTDAVNMARELLARRAQVRRYEEALERIEKEHDGDYTPGHAVRRREIARDALATRTPDAGRAEPKTEDEPIFPLSWDEPGTSPREPAEPDEADVAARLWVLDHEQTPYREDIASLAALIRTREAAAREAGRVEGWDEAVEECAKRVPNWSEDGRYCDLRYDIVLADILSVKLAARRPGGGK